MTIPLDLSSLSVEGKGFDLNGFIEFCRSKPAGQEYPRLNGGQCALAQFGCPGAGYWNLDRLGIPENVYNAAAHSYPSTFGALADRLEALR